MLLVLAAGLVITAFCMKDILHLRIVAVASDVTFLAYGAALGWMPVWLLDLLLLPVSSLGRPACEACSCCSPQIRWRGRRPLGRLGRLVRGVTKGSAPRPSRPDGDDALHAGPARTGGGLTSSSEVGRRAR